MLFLMLFLSLLQGLCICITPAPGEGGGSEVTGLRNLLAGFLGEPERSEAGEPNPEGRALDHARGKAP